MERRKRREKREEERKGDTKKRGIRKERHTKEEALQTGEVKLLGTEKHLPANNLEITYSLPGVCSAGASVAKNYSFCKLTSLIKF